MGGGAGDHPLLERDVELGALQAALAGAGAGRGSVVLVEGPAGIGKTSLLRAARDLAGGLGFRPLGARASDLESAFPFGVVRQLLEPPLAMAPAAERARMLEGAAALAEPTLVADAPDAAARANDAGFAVLHGLYWLMANLAQTGPVALTVDDLHWADAPSLRFLAFLASRVGDLPLCLIVAARSDETGPHEDLVARLAADPATTMLHPGPISAPAATALLERAFRRPPAPEFARACHAAVAGNPLYLDQLAAQLAAAQVEPTAEGAGRVAEAAAAAIGRGVALRVGRMAEGTPALARAVAVLGDGCELRHAARLAELPVGTATGCADELERASLIEPGKLLAFVHPVVRWAVYQDMAPRARSDWHARAASLLLDDGAGLDRVTTHLLATDPRGDDQVVATLRAAGEEALGRGAPEAAVAYLRRALAEPPAVADRGSLLHDLGTVEARLRDPMAVERLEKALELSPGARARGEITIELGRALIMEGRVEDARHRFEAALAEATADPDMTLRLEAELISAARLDISRRAQAAARLERVAEGLEGSTPAERVVLANLAFELLVRGEPAAVTARLAERALGGGALLEEQSPDSPVVYLAAWALALADRLEDSERALQDALGDARVRGSASGFTIASCFRANVAYRMGALQECEASARAVLDIEPEHRWAIGLPLVAGFLIEALIERGAFDEARDVLEGTGMANGDIPDFTLFIVLLFARGKLRLARGEREDGVADLLLCGRRSVAWGSRNPTFLPWRSTAALALDDRERALELIAEEAELAERAGAERASGLAARARGVLEADAAALERAAETLAGCGARLEHARALVDLGALHRRQSRRTEARDPLRAGLEGATRCGATALAERAREELVAAGARPRRVALRGVEALTASERRVAVMAASGMKNREIAQALFVTLKTVEVHLSHSYAKLGVSSRDGLPAALTAKD